MTPELLAERTAAFALHCRGLRERSGVERRYLGIDLYASPDWTPEPYRLMASLLLDLIDRPQLVALGGDRGTGKTALAFGAVRAFCDCGLSATYARVADYFDALAGVPWDAKPSVKDEYGRPDLLVLDEVQVRDADRAWQDNELTTLIDRRYGERRATLLVSNLRPDALRSNLGTSIWRRLVEEGGVYEATEEKGWPPLAKCPGFPGRA